MRTPKCGGVLAVFLAFGGNMAPMAAGCTIPELVVSSWYSPGVLALAAHAQFQGADRAPFLLKDNLSGEPLFWEHGFTSV